MLAVPTVVTTSDGSATAVAYTGDSAEATDAGAPSRGRRVSQPTPPGWRRGDRVKVINGTIQSNG